MDPKWTPNRSQAVFGPKFAPSEKYEIYNFCKKLSWGGKGGPGSVLGGPLGCSRANGTESYLCGAHCSRYGVRARYQWHDELCCIYPSEVPAEAWAAMDEVVVQVELCNT